MTEIILGAANLGKKYGVASGDVLLTKEESKSIIAWAQTNGVNHFDTAFAYGESNGILADCLDHSAKPKIDTKLDEKSCQSSKLIIETTKSMMQKLGVDEFSVLYLHNEELLKSSLASEISIGLKEILSQGIARRIGVSVYSQSSVLDCKMALPELSVFQVPENICDRRLIASSEIQRLSEEGNSFVVRSIFLQGLLLMNPNSIPKALKSAVVSLQELNYFSRNNSLTVLDLCLAYVRSISWASAIVVGVHSVDQLKEIQGSSYLLPRGWATSISNLPQEIIDPRNWTL